MVCLVEKIQGTYRLENWIIAVRLTYWAEQHTQIVIPDTANPHCFTYSWKNCRVRLVPCGVGLSCSHVHPCAVHNIVHNNPHMPACLMQDPPSIMQYEKYFFTNFRPNCWPCVLTKSEQHVYMLLKSLTKSKDSPRTGHEDPDWE